MYRYTEKTGLAYLCIALIGEGIQFVFFSDDEPAITLSLDDIAELTSPVAKSCAISACNAS